LINEQRQRQQQCDAEADLEQDLLRIQPAPDRHPPPAQLPGAPAGSCLQQQQHHLPQTLVATKTCLPIPTSGGGLIISSVLFKNFKMIRFSAFSLKLALGAAAALAAISLSPGSAQAFVVTVGGVQYDVNTFTGSADANAVKFNTPANGGMMPWYGNQSLAIDFALAVQGFFGNRTVYATNYIFNPNPLVNTNMKGIFWDTQYGTKPTPVPCLDCFTGGALVALIMKCMLLQQ
jgi:hypothetical protein